MRSNYIKTKLKVLNSYYNSFLYLSLKYLQINLNLNSILNLLTS